MKGLLMDAKPATLRQRVGKALQNWLSAWAAHQASSDIFQCRIDPQTGKRLHGAHLRRYY